MSNCEIGFNGRTRVLSTIVGAIAGAAVLLLVHRARRDSSERIHGLAFRLPGRVSPAMGPAQEDVSSSVSRGYRAT